MALFGIYTHLFIIDAINEHLVICFVKLQTKHLHVLFIMSLGKFEWLTFSFGFPVSKYHDESNVFPQRKIAIFAWEMQI